MAAAIGTLYRVDGLLIGPDEVVLLRNMSRSGVSVRCVERNSRLGYRLVRGEDEEVVAGRVLRSLAMKELVEVIEDEYRLTDRGRKVRELLKG